VFLSAVTTLDLPEKVVLRGKIPHPLPKTLKPLVRHLPLQVAKILTPLARILAALTQEPILAEPIPVEPIPVEPILAEPIPVEPIPVEPIPVEPIPVEPIPVEPIPVEPILVEPILAEPILAEPILAEPIPVEPIPVETLRPMKIASGLASAMVKILNKTTIRVNTERFLKRSQIRSRTDSITNLKALAP